MIEKDYLILLLLKVIRWRARELSCWYFGKQRKSQIRGVILVEKKDIRWEDEWADKFYNKDVSEW